MRNTIFAATLIALCLLGCQYLGSKKNAGLTVLNVNDLNDQHKQDKQALRAKYDGKEVIVMGRSVDDFNPDHIYFTTGDKTLDFSVQADISKESWVGVDCIVEAANKDKFAGIKKDDVFAVKGILHINEGNMKLSPCTREIRE